MADFVEGKIYAWNLGSKDFDLPILDDNFTYSGSNGSNSHNDEEESYESLIKVNDFYDGTNDGHTSPVGTKLVIIPDGDGEDESGEQPLVRRKRGSDSTVSAALVVVLADREG